MTTMSKRDAVDAAMSVAEDVAEGRLDPADLEHQLVAEVTELVGTVTGPDDPLYELQTKIARGVLAAGGLDHAEVSEWAAVLRRGAGVEPVSATLTPPVDISPPEPVSSASDAHDSESGAVVAEPVDETAPEAVEPETDPVPPGMARMSDGSLIPTHRIAGRGREAP